MFGQSFGEDQPALGLGEDAGVFLCPGIVDDRESAVESVGVVGRIHQESAVFRVQAFIDVVQYYLCLSFGGKTADHSPALGVQPYICLGIFSGTDAFALFSVAPDKTVAVPA